MKAAAIVSGGMDSVTLAYHLRTRTDDLVLVSFDYGQRHVRELACAERAAKALESEWVHVALPDLGAELARSGSSLTNRDVDVPEGHYAEDSMRATVVPNRNAIMLSIAAGIAVGRHYDAVATGVHGGDHFIYPDCRPNFIAALSLAFAIGNDGFAPDGFAIYAPFLYQTKADIAAEGERLGVPWADTWSCYQGAAVHCGACGTCFERREAFTLAGVSDPTEYAATPQYVAP